MRRNQVGFSIVSTGTHRDSGAYGKIDAAELVAERGWRGALSVVLERLGKVNADETDPLYPKREALAVEMGRAAVTFSQGTRTLLVSLLTELKGSAGAPWSPTISALQAIKQVATVHDLLLERERQTAAYVEARPGVERIKTAVSQLLAQSAEAYRIIEIWQASAYKRVTKMLDAVVNFFQKVVDLVTNLVNLAAKIVEAAADVVGGAAESFDTLKWVAIIGGGAWLGAKVYGEMKGRREAREEGR